MRLIKRLIFLALIRGPFLSWVVFNGGLFEKDPEARMFKVAVSLVAAMTVAAFIMDWLL